MKLYKKLLPLLGTAIVAAPTVLTSCNSIKCRFEYSRSSGQPLIYDKDIIIPTGVSFSEDTALHFLMETADKTPQLLPNDIAYYKINAIQGEEYIPWRYDDINIEFYGISEETIENSDKFFLSFSIRGTGFYTDENENQHAFNSYIKMNHLRYCAQNKDPQALIENHIWLILPWAYAQWLNIPFESRFYVNLFELLVEEENWYITFTLDVQDQITATANLSNDIIKKIMPGDATEMARWTAAVLTLLSFYSYFLHNVIPNKN